MDSNRVPCFAVCKQFFCFVVREVLQAIIKLILLKRLTLSKDI